MANNWSDIGEDIKAKVDDAIRSGDFSDLSRSIGDSVNDAIDAVKGSVFGASPSAGKQVVYDADYQEVTSTASEKPVSQKPLYEKKPKKLASLLMVGFGYAFGILFAAAALLFMILSLAGVGLFWPLTIAFAIVAVALLGVGTLGLNRLRLLDRYRRYIRTIGDKLYVSVTELQNATKKTVELTTKDIKYLIKHNWFYESHLDEQEGYLILSDEAYSEYTVAKDAYTKRSMEEKAKAEMSDLPEEVRLIIREGEDYVAHIRECNHDIPDPGISAKLDKMELVVSRIFEELRKQPQKAKDLKRTMNYYLPTTAKLLDAYRELDQQTVIGENIRKSKQEIADALDTLNAAFEKMFDDLFAAKAMDISSDISVLNTLLAQEGLKEKI